MLVFCPHEVTAWSDPLLLVSSINELKAGTKVQPFAVRMREGHPMPRSTKLLVAILSLALVGCSTGGPEAKERAKNTSSSGSSVYTSDETTPGAEDAGEKGANDKPGEPVPSEGTESQQSSPTEQEAQQGSFSITQEEVEAQVEFIRTCYYTPGPDDAQVTLEGGEGGWEYSRDYRYHNGELIFAFIYRGTEEHRLYFKDGHLIRYIDENHTVFDFGQLEPFYWWEQRALAEGNQYAPEDSTSSSHRSAWWGNWEGDDGETLVVTEVTADHVSLTYNGWTASGQEMFHSNYVLGFLDEGHTRVGESDEVLDTNGWRYEFALDGNRIVMSSRSPDRSFYRQ